MISAMTIPGTTIPEMPIPEMAPEMAAEISDAGTISARGMSAAQQKGSRTTPALITPGPAVLWRVMAVTEAVEPDTVGPIGDADDLWPYRDRTVALLKHYARASVEVGRLPSLLGREFFRARITSYSMMSFEDIVIFVLDVEMALERLGPLQRKLIAMNVLEEYSFPEVARLFPCPLRTVERELPEAINQLSRIFLDGGLIRKLPMGTRGEKSCQEGKNYNFGVNDCRESKNNSCKVGGIDPCKMLF
jgi:Sigma-70, region 4